MGQRRQGRQPENPEPRDLPQQLRRRGGRPRGRTGPHPGRRRYAPPQRRRGRARPVPGRQGVSGGLRLRLQRRSDVARAGASGRERDHRSATRLRPRRPGGEGRHLQAQGRGIRARERRGAVRSEPPPRQPRARGPAGAGQGGRGLDRGRHPARGAAAGVDAGFAAGPRLDFTTEAQRARRKPRCSASGTSVCRVVANSNRCARCALWCLPVALW